MWSFVRLLLLLLTCWLNHHHSFLLLLTSMLVSHREHSPSHISPHICQLMSSLSKSETTGVLWPAPAAAAGTGAGAPGVLVAHAHVHNNPRLSKQAQHDSVRPTKQLGKLMVAQPSSPEISSHSVSRHPTVDVAATSLFSGLSQLQCQLQLLCSVVSSDVLCCSSSFLFTYIQC